jgi:hypothetical protein
MMLLGARGQPCECAEIRAIGAHPEVMRWTAPVDGGRNLTGQLVDPGFDVVDRIAVASAQEPIPGTRQPRRRLARDGAQLLRRLLQDGRVERHGDVGSPCVSPRARSPLETRPQARREGQSLVLDETVSRPCPLAKAGQLNQ